MHTIYTTVMTIEPVEPLVAQASELIEQRTGLAVGAQFRIDLKSILEDLAGGDLPQFLVRMRASHETSPEWQALLRALTIGETYFFRDTLPFELLRTTILPDLIRERRQKKRFDLAIWCAGCATGEEVYSTAITLYEMLPDFAQWTIRLNGSDINVQALETARQGIYRDWSFRHTSPDFQARYFDSTPDGWQIKPQIRAVPVFRQANLLDGAPNPPYDVVFCRNTLLYFARGYVERAETTLYNALAPAGWLVLGQSEAIRTYRERWVLRVFSNAIFYQKPAHAQRGTLSYVETPARSDGDGYYTALSALHHDQSEEAERTLRRLITEQPQNIQPRLLLAYILACRHNVEEAHAHLDAALQIEAMAADAYYLRATLHLESGEIAEAERALRAALYCRRDHPLAAFLLGNLAYKAGNLPRALRAWESARRAVAVLQPDSWFSDFTDMTAASFEALVRSQLDSAGQ